MHPLVSTELVTLAQACPVMVGVIGPPGAGKSTVVRQLSTVDGCAVFRLREAVRTYTDVIDAAASSIDAVGWIDDRSVSRVLAAAFVAGRFPAGDGLVLLDNFPGSAAQLRLLLEVAAGCGRRVALLELRVGASIVAGRTAARRVCPGCGPDPHHPAVAAVGDPDRCARCGGGLVRRDSDTPTRHGLRLARYRDHIAGIGALARYRNVPYAVIDAGRPAEQVHRAVPTAVRWLVTTAVAHTVTAPHLVRS